MIDHVRPMVCNGAILQGLHMETDSPLYTGNSNKLLEWLGAFCSYINSSKQKCEDLLLVTSKLLGADILSLCTIIIILLVFK